MHLGDSTFNIFLSFVHWVCINENTLYMFVLRRRTAKNCEIFNNSKWHSPFFQFSKYILHFWHARKLVNSSSFRLFSMIFFLVHQNMLHNQCRLHYLSQTGYKVLCHSNSVAHWVSSMSNKTSSTRSSTGLNILKMCCI
jgi:hypothetical protein